MALAAVGFGRLERDPRAALAHRAAGAFGAALAFAAVLRLSGDASGLAPTLVAPAVTGCGAALLAGGRRRLTPGGVSRLIVDLGNLHDARSLERRLGDALGDPRLELSYSTAEIAHDNEAVRAALGYEAVDFFGTSYGGVDAAAYATRFGSRLRSIVLSGPWGQPFFEPFDLATVRVRHLVERVGLLC